MMTKLFNIRVATTIVLLFHGAIVSADGVWPTIGRPAIVSPGGVLDGDVSEASTAYLVHETERVALNPVASGALYSGAGTTLQVPATIEPGVYDFVVSVEGKEIVRPRAVQVLDEIPATYTIALVRGVQPSPEEGPKFSDELLAAIALEKPAFVFVFGALTLDGSAVAYSALQDRFSGLMMPVMFCPSREEFFRGSYEAVFGPSGYNFSLGEDGYLMLGPDMTHGGSGTVERVGYVHRWRRALRASRWSVGVAERFGLDWSMRSQLVLFVDDPLDYLLVGDAPAGASEKVPWGTTRFVVPPETLVLPLQFIDVDESAMVLRGVPVVE